MKNIQELEEVLLVKQPVDADNYAAGTVNGSSVDTKDYDSLLVILNLGDMEASGTVDLKLQDSSDDSTFADITDAAFSQKVDATDDNKVFIGRIKCKNYDRYVRPVVTVATAASDLAVQFILAKHDGLAPVSQDNTVEFKLDYDSDGGTVGSQST